MVPFCVQTGAAFAKPGGVTSSMTVGMPATRKIATEYVIGILCLCFIFQGFIFVNDIVHFCFFFFFWYMKFSVGIGVGHLVRQWVLVCGVYKGMVICYQFIDSRSLMWGFKLVRGLMPCDFYAWNWILQVKGYVDMDIIYIGFFLFVLKQRIDMLWCSIHSQNYKKIKGLAQVCM